MKYTSLLVVLGLFILPALWASPKAAVESDIPLVEQKVTTHLKSYFMTHAAEGVPSSARASAVEVDIDSTEDVQGWTGRWRTTGTATITTADIHTENYACTFEVISEISDKNVVKIIETKAKRKD